MHIGETIYRLRTEAGLSQSDLAEALGVSRQSISKWETGASVPDLDKLIKLRELFHVSLDTLVQGETEPTAEHSAAPSPPPFPSSAPYPHPTNRHGLDLLFDRSGLGIMFPFWPCRSAFCSTLLGVRFDLPLCEKASCAKSPMDSLSPDGRLFMFCRWYSGQQRDFDLPMDASVELPAARCFLGAIFAGTWPGGGHRRHPAQNRLDRVGETKMPAGSIPFMPGGHQHPHSIGTDVL